jgi:hypothetical protein
MAVLHGSDIAHATQSGGTWELLLQGAIGHAAPLAQQGDHLLHDRDNVHPVSSLPGVRSPCAYASAS